MGYVTTKEFDKTRCWCWVINNNVFCSGYLYFWCVSSLEKWN